jgi:quercetin dioxygenase-like cupin family protein
MAGPAPSLEGWDITRAVDADWVPWGDRGDARAKILGQADGYVVALVEAEEGYRGTSHEHSHPEFFYLVEGNIRNQGQTIKSGDGYAAATGSVHTDFEAESPSTYLIIFRI